MFERFVHNRPTDLHNNHQVFRQCEVDKSGVREFASWRHGKFRILRHPFFRRVGGQHHRNYWGKRFLKTYKISAYGAITWFGWGVNDAFALVADTSKTGKVISTKDIQEAGQPYRVPFEFIMTSDNWYDLFKAQGEKRVQIVHECQSIYSNLSRPTHPNSFHPASN